MRRARVAVAAALGALACALGYAHLTRGRERTDNAQVEADVVPLRARVEGHVLRVGAAEDARVRKGDLIVELDPREYAARVKRAAAELDAARAEARAADQQASIAEAGARGGRATARALVSSRRAARSSADAEITVARAAIARAEAEARRTGLELGRARQMRALDVASQRELETAEAADEAARAAVISARAQLAAAEQLRREASSRVAEAEGELDQRAPVEERIEAARAAAALAHARVRIAEAELERAELSLEHTRILAPADGVVSRLSAREGQALPAGQVIAQLVPPRMYVVANFKETQAATLRSGQRAEVRLDAFPGRALGGRVESVSAGTGARFSLLPPDNASGNFVKIVQRVPVRVALTGVPEDLILLAGLSAEVTVFTAEAPGPPGR